MKKLLTKDREVMKSIKQAYWIKDLSIHRISFGQ